MNFMNISTLKLSIEAEEAHTYLRVIQHSIRGKPAHNIISKYDHQNLVLAL